MKWASLTAAGAVVVIHQIGGIGEDEINACPGHGAHDLDAVAVGYIVEKRVEVESVFFRVRHCLVPLGPGGFLLGLPVASALIQSTRRSKRPSLCWIPQKEESRWNRPKPTENAPAVATSAA